MAKVQTLKVSFAIGRHVKRDGFACLDEGQRAKPLGSQVVVVDSSGLSTRSFTPKTSS